LLLRNVYESLLARKPDGSFVPWLATGYKVSPDGKTYTFTLRDGVKFSDGAPLDAQAVARNFLNARNPAYSGGSQLAAQILHVADVKTPDARTVVITLDEPYALTVRSWGIGELALRVRHALRHAALPAVTLAGWLVGGLLSGAVITEQVFGRPGLGKITVDAVLSKDMPVILAIAILSAAIYVALSTAVDLLYLLIDPRL
ncbi:ABC transporter substrate-binding protein, partial [Burkholderia contaminans]|uniref:ABC transporter substrate-binding protein n=1 Tax=Burkholderia contaminans TaxID=488447 RepID=UPI002D7F898C